MVIDWVIFGHGLEVIGEIIIGYTAIRVHQRVWKEHKIDKSVYTEMAYENKVGLFGIGLIVIGFLLQVLSSKTI